ncbi:MAG: glycosyltransferase family 39 protein [Anaerolineae bacterium]
MTAERAALLPAVAAALALTLALGLRLHGVADQSLWYDEGTSAGLATRDAATIVRNASNDIHPPLYYLALAAWARVAGRSEAGLRGLSVMAGVVLVALVLGLGKRLWSRSEALAAGLLAAVSPFLVWYSQEARMYALAAALATALAWVASELTDPRKLSGGPGWPMEQTGKSSAIHDRAAEPPPALWAAYVALAAAALYTHYFVGASAVAAANLIALAGIVGRWRASGNAPRELSRRWVVAQAVVAALFVPWVVAAWHTIRDWPTLGPAMGTVALAREALATFSMGIHRVPAPGALVLVSGALALAGLAAAADEKRRWGVLVASAMVVGPLAAMWFLSQTRPAWDPKFLIAAAPGFDLLMAAGAVGVGRLVTAQGRSGEVMRAPNAGAPGQVGGAGDGRQSARTRRQRVFGMAVTLALLTLAVWPRARALQAAYDDPRLRRDDYREIVAALSRQASADDAVIVTAPTQVEVVDYYDRGRHTIYPLPLERPPDAGATIARLEDAATDHRDLYAVLWATDEADPDGIVEGWLNAHRAKAFDDWYGNVRLAMWARQREPVGTVGEERVAFGDDEVLLAGWAVGPVGASGAVVAAPGDVITVDAWWAVAGDGGPAADYTVFLHLVDPDGIVVAQRDMAPRGGSERTSTWQPATGLRVSRDADGRSLGVEADKGTVVRDRMALVLPDDTPPGACRLLLGLYDPRSGARLTAEPTGARAPEARDEVTRGAADSVVLADVTVVAAGDGSVDAARGSDGESSGGSSGTAVGP